MTQSVEQRLSYHPHPGAGRYSWPFGHRNRRVEQRLAAVLKQVDVAGKRVLDLGCSGGYFSFNLGERAAHVWAVDADPVVMERNKEIATQLGRSNMTFICDVISPQLIYSLPQVDVVLFLSVLHHMLASSEAYQWNQQQGADVSLAVLAAIAARTTTLVFEMGTPDEGYEWGARLPEMEPSPQAWITRLLAGCFEAVEVIPAPAYSGPVGRIRRAMSGPASRGGVRGRGLRRLFAIDPRDGRDLFVARRPRIGPGRSLGEPFQEAGRVLSGESERE